MENTKYKPKFKIGSKREKPFCCLLSVFTSQVWVAECLTAPATTTIISTALERALWLCFNVLRLLPAYNKYFMSINYVKDQLDSFRRPPHGPRLPFPLLVPSHSYNWSFDPFKYSWAPSICQGQASVHGWASPRLSGLPTHTCIQAKLTLRYAPSFTNTFVTLHESELYTFFIAV